MKLSNSIIKKFTSKEYMIYREDIKNFYLPIICKQKKIEEKQQKATYLRQSILIYWENHPKLKRKNPYLVTLNNVKYRCNNPKDKAYKNYGGRGIKCFLSVNDIKTIWVRDKAYMMKQPSIHRIDNDGNYTFENCQYIEMEKHRRLKR